MALLCFIGSGIGCNRTTDAGPTKTVAPQVQSPSTQPQAHAESRPPSTTVSRAPIKDAVEKLLARQEASDTPVIPKGTRLLSADFKDGIASLDFSKEFNGLANHGDTVESKAQKALRRALAGVHGVDKMRVTVEGQPFDSQATDWNTPFPVREDEDDTNVSRSDSSEAADTGSKPQ